MHSIEELQLKLKEHGFKITKPRMAILEVMLKHIDGPISAEDIFNKIDETKEINCDLVSVYRSLTAFEEIGLIQKIDLFEGAAHFQLIDETQKHRHFFICEKCNKMEKLDSCLVGPLEGALKKKGYTHLSHRLELTGICPSCSSNIK